MLELDTLSVVEHILVVGDTVVGDTSDEPMAKRIKTS
jgi:hypothetical protein